MARDDDYRNVQPRVQLAIITPEGAIGDGSKLESAMENEARAPGSSAFGALLRRYRVAAGLSQEILAERARMSREGISALERGFRRTPQRETLALLAAALKLSDADSRDFEAAATRWVLLGRGKGSSVTIGPWPNRPTSNLPLALISFVGREVELAEIAALIRERRLVTLTGTGGVGKTQTALQVGAALRDGTDARVWLIELAPIGDPSLVASAIASTLGVQEVPNRPVLQTLIAYLKTKAVLLILDNCEHVITEAAIVAGTPVVGLSTRSDTCHQPRSAPDRGRTYLQVTVAKRPDARGSGATRRNRGRRVWRDRSLCGPRSRRRSSVHAHRRECAGRCRYLPATGRHTTCD